MTLHSKVKKILIFHLLQYFFLELQALNNFHWSFDSYHADFFIAFNTS